MVDEKSDATSDWESYSSYPMIDTPDASSINTDGFCRASPPEYVEWDDTPRCSDCGIEHHPRRLVICIDDTLATPPRSRLSSASWRTGDSSSKTIGNSSKFSGSFIKSEDHPMTYGEPSWISEEPHQNSSNIYRIWSLLPAERKLARDRKGRLWQQIRHDYINVADFPANKAGRGSSSAIDFMSVRNSQALRELYKTCCNLCARRDEICLFGYGKGGFLATALAAILYYLKAIPPNRMDFDQAFDEGYRIVCTARSQDGLRLFAERWLEDQRPRDACNIRFLGCFDPVQGFESNNLHEMLSLENLKHTRIALPLFEERSFCRSTRAAPKDAFKIDGMNRTFQQAYFVGSHGNLGGGNEEDGLSLWPLQWILFEAERYGVHLEPDNGDSKGPRDLRNVLSAGKEQRRRAMYCKNGISMEFNDITHMFIEAGYGLSLAKRRKDLSDHGKRVVYEQGRLIGQVLSSPLGAFIHPSVFFMDNRVISIVRTISDSMFSKSIRGETAFLTEDSQRLLEPGGRRKVRAEADQPRILLCGPSTVGKSTLINLVLDDDVILPSSTERDHDIDHVYSIEGRPHRFHDTAGFEMEVTAAVRFANVERFVHQRAQSPVFNEQVHCIWYCWQCKESNKIQDADRIFMSKDFAGVPVILVFTKLDELRALTAARVFKDYKTSHPDCRKAQDIGRLTIDQQDEVRALQDAALTIAQEGIRQRWQAELGNQKNVKMIFVSNDPMDEDTITELLSLSEGVMRGEAIATIHANAQRLDCDIKLHKSVEVTVANFMQMRPRIDLETDSYVEAIAKKVATDMCEIYSYDDMEARRVAEQVWAHLHPETSHSLWKKLSTAVMTEANTIASSGPVSASTDSNLLLPAALIAYPSVIVTSAIKARWTQLPMMLGCLDTLLVLQRMYWFEDEAINEQNIHTACIYYAKFQREAHQALRDEFVNVLLDPAYSSRKVERVLLQTVEQFKFHPKGRDVR